MERRRGEEGRVRERQRQRLREREREKGKTKRRHNEKEAGNKQCVYVCTCVDVTERRVGIEFGTR